MCDNLLRQIKDVMERSQLDRASAMAAAGQRTCPECIFGPLPRTAAGPDVPRDSVFKVTSQ